MFAQLAKWFTRMPQQRIEHYGKGLQMDLIYRGIDCRINIHRIDNEEYGLGVTSSAPLNEADISGIHRYLVSEGFIQRALS
jgi:hypothetical protein